MNGATLFSQIIGGVTNGTAQRLFWCAFATGFGFGCGILLAAQLFGLIGGLRD